MYYWMTACVLALSASCFGGGEIVRYEMEPHREFQRIDGFGASDAWQCQFVGKYWPLAKRNAMADLLFSREVDKAGNPKGIGLSIWRFNIGAGSAEQGADSGIANPWRRAECFVNSDGSYNWSRQEGQQWFLKAAKARGVECLLGFLNSPPVFFTKNGRAFPETKGTTLNLRPDRFDDLARFVAEVAGYFKGEGLGLRYVCPVNEPQWDWTNGTQEGSPATNQEIYKVAKVISAELGERGLETEVMLPEAASLEFLYKGDLVNKSQVDVLWEPSSPWFVGNIPKVAPVVAGHSYYTTWPVDRQTSVRVQLAEKLKELKEPPAFWQSEYCILREDITDYKIGRGRIRDLAIDTALFYARVIHYDLVLANAASWQFWTAISCSNFKDGLIYLDSGKDASGKVLYDRDAMQRDGRFHDSKTLWALGNYSRFVTPGMRRIGVASMGGSNGGLLVSAYKDESTSRAVAVIVNYSEEGSDLSIGGMDAEVELFTTSRTGNLKRTTGNAGALRIDKRSVVTVVGRLSGH